MKNIHVIRPNPDTLAPTSREVNKEESTKHYHIINGVEESHIYNRGDRSLLFKNDMIYLSKQFGNYGWFEFATTTDQQLAFYWLETGELSRMSQHPYWEASYGKDQK